MKMRQPQRPQNNSCVIQEIVLQKGIIYTKDKIYKNTEKPGYRSIDVRVFLLYYIIYRTADRVELRIVYRNKSKKT